MAERPNAYVRKNPGDVIQSNEWNELQVRAREEIRAHRHTGNEDGSLIPRAGIEAGAIDGKLIDPAAEVNVRTLTTSGNLIVKGELAVNGKALLGDITDLLATVKGLQDDKLNRRGDTISGTLRVQKNLLVDSNVGIGTTTPTHQLHVVAENAVGLFESSGEMAYLRLSTKEGLENRVEIANRPGGRLSLWNNGKDVFNITRNGNVGIGTTTPGQKLTVQGDHNAGRDPDSGLLYGGQLAIKGPVCQLDFINTNHAGWAIHVNSLNKMYFVRAPWNCSDLVLDGSGNIGIGTDNPLQQLTITGGLGFANQGAGDKKLYSPKDGLLEWMTHDAAGDHGFAVSHQGQARVYLNTNGNSYLNGGNVGIGTTNPDAKLHLVDVPQEAHGHTLIIGKTDASNMRLGCHNDYTWIQAHNSRHLVLNPLGNNVGIGTSAPTHQFHVVADGGLFESSSDSAYLRLATKEGVDKRVEIIHRPGGRLSLWNNGEDVFNITRDHNVGIGTITPSQKLMVQGGHNSGRDPDSALLYGGQLAIKSNACQIDFIDTDPGHDDWAIMVNGSKMHFIKEPWTYTNLVLAANGNVGIGTDNPLQQLTITGGLGFANQGAGDKKLYSPKDGLLEWMTHSAAGDPGFAVSHQGEACVYLSTDGNSYLNGGNVGIGTTTPSRKLQIGPDVDGLGFELAQHASPNVGVLRFGDNTGWKLHFGRSREVPNGELNSGLAGVLMTIKDNGNVGIGTNNPLSPLHVEGNIRIAGTLTPATDCLRVYGFISAWQTYFSAYVATNDQSGPRNPLPMTATSNNIGSCYDIATSKFTAPVNGVYLFTMSGFRGDSGTDLLHWFLMVNDSYANSGGTSTDESVERSALTWRPPAYTVCSRTILVPLKLGDKVYIKQDGTGRCDNFRSGLEGVLLSATN